MEKNFYNDEFEQLLKEKSDGFRMYPSKRVWHSIYNDLHPGRKWPSIAMGLSLIIALIFIGYINNNQAGSKETTAVTAGTTGQNDNGTIARELPVNDNTLLSAGNNDIAGRSSSFSNLISALRQPAVNNDFSGSATYSPVFDPNIVAMVNKMNGRNRNTTNNNSGRITRNVRSRFASHTEGGNIASAATATPGRENISSRSSSATTDETETTTDVNSNRKISPATAATITAPDTDNSDRDNNNLTLAITAASAENKAIQDQINTDAQKTKTVSAAADKAWLENYAFYNKKSSKSKWKGRMDVEFYATPNIGYRKLTGGAVYDANPLTAINVVRGDVGNTVSHTPALGLEAGTAFAYSLTKKLQIKAGLQFNYTSYGINAGTTHHPVLTSLLLADPATGNEYTSSRISTLSNESGDDPVKVFNTTYQVSLPVGLAVKLWSNNKISWYAGASFQPTYIFGGQANLLSSDRRNYISEPSMLHNWNFNTGAETYLSYKMNGYSLQVGPQFRYQLMSTYDKKYVNSERLYNAGIKVGIVKRL